MKLTKTKKRNMNDFANYTLHNPICVFGGNDVTVSAQTDPIDIGIGGPLDTEVFLAAPDAEERD